jgi:nucleotide-binding universal stress UspA family protein
MGRRRVCPLVRETAEESDLQQWVKFYGRWYEVAEMIGVSCETLHVKDRHPGEGIIETAREKACDLIVMASHGRRGLGRLILGSVANEVVTHSTIPVLIYR